MNPIVHQTWKDAEVPAQWKSYVDGWKIYPYRLWTDEDISAFMRDVDFWGRYNTQIEKVDAARYFILKEFGGIYVDLDFELIKDITPLLTHSFVVGMEPEEHAAAHGQERLISNAFMAAEKHCGFLDHICGRLQHFQQERDPLRTTGPIFLTQMYDEYQEKHEISILHSKYLFPLIKDRVDVVTPTDLSNDTYAVHYYWGSWWR